jgi:hypothetical protein
MNTMGYVKMKSMLKSIIYHIKIQKIEFKK